ncbi:uncharacterized protein LOC144443736 [Glandiceps talaboti]
MSRSLFTVPSQRRVTGAFSNKSKRASVSSSERSGSSNDAVESPKSEKAGDVFTDTIEGANNDNQENNNEPDKRTLMKKTERRKKISRSKSFAGVTEMLNGAISKIDDSRNRHFHKLFKQIPQEEYAITSYTCALLKGTILLQGRLYVARNWFCFHSNIFGKETQVKIPVLTIKSITRERTALVVPNAIGIRTMDDKKHVFGSLLSRPMTYKTLVTIWQSVLRDYAEEDISISQDSSVRDEDEDLVESDTDSTQVEPSSPVRQKELAEAAQNAAKAAIEEFSSNEGEDMEDSLPLIDRPISDIPCHEYDGPTPKESRKSRLMSSLARGKSSMSSQLSKVCNLVLRPVYLLQKVPHTHMFIMFASVLAIFLLASSALLSYRIFHLKPMIEADSFWSPQEQHSNHINKAYSDSYLLNHRVHTAAVEKIHATLAANLQALSQVHSSLETLKQQAANRKKEDEEGSDVTMETEKQGLHHEVHVEH